VLALWSIGQLLLGLAAHGAVRLAGRLARRCRRDRRRPIRGTLPAGWWHRPTLVQARGRHDRVVVDCAGQRRGADV